MIRLLTVGLLITFVSASFLWSTSSKEKQALFPADSIQFTKRQISSDTYESVGVFDVNNDKNPDIVSGAYWYEGPAFEKKHFIAEVPPHNEYFDDFATVPLDVNGDGKTDFFTGGWWGKVLRWKENSGTTASWTTHELVECGSIESARGWDVDGDGVIEIVPNTPGKPLAFYRFKPATKGKLTPEFTRHEVVAAHGHGLGFGDVNGDGRGDFIIDKGWIEAPAKPLTDSWIVHPEFNLGVASVPIIVADINSDQRNDLIVGQGHAYGLDWYEQKVDRKGNRIWMKHSIDSLHSQYHTMEWTDLDGDQKPELITGKRYRAHNDSDPGAHDPLGLFVYKWNGKAFTKQIISYGPLGTGKGTGIYMSIADLRGAGRKDIVVAGKEGLYVFFNEGK
jgi:hypothetical protein